MPAPATLTGQDVGEAEGALTALLNQVLSNTDITRTQYITLRVLALRGPAPSPAELHDYLASQPQLGLDRSQIAELLCGLEAKGLVAGSAADGPGPTQLTAEGAALHARLAEAVGAVTRRVYAGLDPDDLATTTACWSRSPNALGASVTNPDGPAARPRQPGHAPTGRPQAKSYAPLTGSSSPDRAPGSASYGWQPHYCDSRARPCVRSSTRTAWYG
jgi:DNA-binding MarR family transcriptional regulator